MNPELLAFHAQVVACLQPEDLFGKTATEKTIKKLFHTFAKVAHEDRYIRPDEKRLATVAFQKLNALHQLANEKISQGIYGRDILPSKKNLTPPSMTSKKGIYVVTSPLAGGDVSSVYRGEFDGKTPVIIKISDAPTNNVFLQNEAIVLTHLNQSAAGSVSYQYFFPTLLDSFDVKVDTTTRHVNVFNSSDDLRQLHDVVAQYPQGVNERTFIWVMKRLLSTLSFAHSCGVIHGAILPPHILIHPVNHGVRLLDWCFVSKDSPIPAVSKRYASWYPPEVGRKEQATAATDIYMLANVMCYLLGGDFGTVPLAVHPKFRRFLESCLIKHPARRPSSAWDCREELSKLAYEVVGPKKYEKLEMV